MRDIGHGGRARARSVGVVQGARASRRVSERHAQRRDDAGDSVVFPERDARRRVSDVVPVSRDGDVLAASETIE